MNLENQQPMPDSSKIKEMTEIRFKALGNSERRFMKTVHWQEGKGKVFWKRTLEQ